jgi:GNAT superfamily N-acetyltransferase
MRIRRATSADCAPIWAVHTRAIRHSCATHYAPEDIAAWSGRMTPAAYAEPLLTRSMFVAEHDDGRIAGFAQLDPVEGTVEAVYVDPDFGRQGIGRALMAAIEQEALRLRLPRLVLVASLNAVAFYEALGFVVEADVRHAIGGDHRIAAKLMSKRLGTQASAGWAA